jgi:hypothetical protein
MDVPCQFCGEKGHMYRCVACGTWLCQRCTAKKFSLGRSLLTLAIAAISILLAASTDYVSLLGLLPAAAIGFRRSRCLKCGSNNIKEIGSTIL